MCCTATDDVVDETELILIQACVCCSLAAYPKFPHCLGCSFKEEACCFLCQGCCKCGHPSLNCTAFGEAACIQVGVPCCAFGCKSPTTCCKSQCQLCFLVASCAFPPDDEIPGACAVLCLSLWPKFGCCVRLRNYTVKGSFLSSSGAPPVPDKLPVADPQHHHHDHPKTKGDVVIDQEPRLSAGALAQARLSEIGIDALRPGS